MEAMQIRTTHYERSAPENAFFLMMNPKTEYVKEACCGLDHHHSKPRGKNNFTVRVAISRLIEFPVRLQTQRRKVIT